jgi:hypothetical protein
MMMREVTTREGRLFGMAVAAAVAATAGVVVPLIRRTPFPVWPFVTGAVLLLVALIAPNAFRTPKRLSVLLSRKTAAVQSRVVLTILFFLVITPLGLLLRGARRRRLIDRAARTYRLQSVRHTRADFEKPF